MILRGQDNKILRATSGEVSVDSGGNSSLILKLDADLQQRNRIFKDGSNAVSQITEKAQNIPFVQSDSAKQPVYNYGDAASGGYPYLEIASGKGLTTTKFPKNIIEGTRDWTMEFWVWMTTSSDAVVEKRGNGGASYGWAIFVGGSSNLLAYISSNGTSWDVASGNTITESLLPRETWYHIALVNESNTLKSYVNGVLQPITIDTSSGFYEDDAEMRIGANISYSATLNGYIKSLELYDYAKTEIQVKQPFTYLKRYK